MKNFIISLFSCGVLAGCSSNYYKQEGNKVQKQMHEVDKTDYAKVETHHKEHVEKKREHIYEVQSAKSSKYNSADHKHYKNVSHRKENSLGSFNFY